MKVWLLDAYRLSDKLVFWIKSENGQNQRVELKYNQCVYAQDCLEARRVLKQLGIIYESIEKRNYLDEWQRVLRIRVPHVGLLERFVRRIEKAANYDIVLYNADLKAEQLYFYEHNLKPCSQVIRTLKGFVDIGSEELPHLKVAHIVVHNNSYDNIKDDLPIVSISYNEEELTGSEEEVLQKFCLIFSSDDPDIILMPYAYAKLPYLEKRLQLYGLEVAFHRWDAYPIRFKGGKSFHSYGAISYRYFSLYLRGRFLIDKKSVVGGDCNYEAMIELAHLTGTLFQTVASRSFGAAFQGALVRELVKDEILVPFKEKPVDQPLSMLAIAKIDRYGHRYDPAVGVHEDVAEIDFSSLYPWIIYNHNISAEMILGHRKPKARVPGTNIQVSRHKKGLVPRTIKPLLDRRMMYKKSPTLVNKSRSAGLKWILVTSYGYLRFREFKLGIASAHMSIGAYSREILLKAADIAQEKGFEIVHGIVDSLYIKKKEVTKEEVKEVCKLIEYETGVPVSFEGIFKWLAFCGSRNVLGKPVPTRYFGMFKSGSIKARDIEIRHRNAPKIVKEYQKEVLIAMGKYTVADIDKVWSEVVALTRHYLDELRYVDASKLSVRIRVGKERYKVNNAQKTIVDKLKKRGVRVRAGQIITFVYSVFGPQLLDEYTGKPQLEEYIKRFRRSLEVVLLPFGFEKNRIEKLFSGQKVLEEKINKEEIDHFSYVKSA